MPRAFITALVLLGVFVFAAFAFSIGSYLLLLLGVLTPLFFMFGMRLDVLAVAAIALFYSSLTIPGMPMNLFLYQAAVLVYVSVAVVQRIIRGHPYKKPPGSIAAWMFIGVLAFIIVFRGIGFRVFGSDKVGGAAYVQIFIGIAFFLLSGSLVFPERKWKIAVIAMALMTLVPFLLNLVVILSYGRIWQPLLFVSVTHSLREVYLAFTTGSQEMRWSILGVLGYVYLIPPFWGPMRGRAIKLYVALFSLSLFFSAMSGYRGTVLTALLFIILFVMVETRRPIASLLGFLAAGALGLVLLAPFANELPFGLKRVLTMVPGLHVSGLAQTAAQQTMDWRYVLWDLALSNIRQYLLVGHGYAQDGSIYAMLWDKQYSMLDQVYFFFMTGELHQGTLDLIYNLGIPGFAAFVFWGWSVIVFHSHRQCYPWNSPDLKRYHLTFLLLLIVNIIYSLLAGISRQFLTSIPFQMALLHGLQISDEKLKEQPLTDQSRIRTGV